MASKIKVDTIENVAGSGNVSLGSGHNLVVPGNITGQGTTTLTGDLAVDTSTLKVDAANNRVGIGIASPQLTGLHIQEPNASNAGKMRLSKATTSSADDGIGTIQFRTGNTTAAANINGRTDASGTGNGALQFMTGTSSSMSEAMRIDSSGRVTMPNQPSFSGREARPENTSGYATVGAIYFNTVSHNNGNHFNNSNGNFTCPITGYYLCLSFCLIDNDQGSSTLARTSFKLNGGEKLVGYDNAHAGSPAYDGMISTGGVIKASANDVITFNVTHGRIHVGAESQMSIHLLA